MRRAATESAAYLMIRNGPLKASYSASVFAECEDEITTLLVANPSAIGLDMEDEQTQGQLMEYALAEHVDRCEACRSWGKQS